jgi:DNA repair photolyase
LLEVFAHHRGFRLGIISKSNLILRDLDLLKEISTRHKLTLHITVTTMNTRLARVLEPRAPRPDLRMNAVATLRQAGLRTGVMCSPLMPGITDSRSSIAAVAKAASQADACFMGAGALFLKPCSQPTFLSFVREHFPAQLKAYEQRYGERAFVSTEYRRRISDLVDAIRREYRLGSRYGNESDAQTSAWQRGATVELQPWLPFS